MRTMARRVVRRIGMPGGSRVRTVLLALVIGAGCGAGPEPLPAAPGEPLPAVRLATVHAAPQRARMPGVIVTITSEAVHVDATALLREARPATASELPGRARFELREVGGDRTELFDLLAQYFAVSGLSESGESRMTVPQIRLRIAADLRFDDLMRVLGQVVRACHGALEFEVATAAGLVAHLHLLPYTFCACPMPPGVTWCAVPLLRIARSGVVLRAAPDLTPRPGCHKAIPYMGETQPPFVAPVDWRDRVIAGPDGGCPTAPVGDAGLDVDALARRLAAVHTAAPGCGWTALDIDAEVPWSIVAASLATEQAELGELRVMLGVNEEPPEHDRRCEDALAPEALVPASPKPTNLGGRLFARPGCAD